MKGACYLMKENKYDDETFFGKYSRMARSTEGLRGAGEWHELRKLLPDFRGKRILDLGCGFGWHCQYAIEHGATSAVGIDISQKMLDEARRKFPSPAIRFLRMPIEDYDYPPEQFDAVLSSLAFHYIESFDDICRKVARTLLPGGSFVFSAEHPVFTAEGSQQWIRGDAGEPLHWPVDNYYIEGKRSAVFLGEPVAKYHRTLTAYVNGLLAAGFEITGLVEPQPEAALLDTVPGMRDELRRPMMLILSAVRKQA